MAAPFPGAQGPPMPLVLPDATLDDWLRWQETRFPRGIDLTLERCRAVVGRLPWHPPRVPIVTVGGTNGKGSTVALLESIYRRAGYRTGAYTSPHLVAYNERIRIDGVPIPDTAIVRAFERLEAVRGAVPLSYFEYGTLAAVDIFLRAEVDVVLLEVGLGGRLDATNTFDADVALVTSIGVDHVHYLGPDRESIGREKAGIFRPSRPAIVGDPDPPASLEAGARRVGAALWRIGCEYGARPGGGDGTWEWWAQGAPALRLPLPAMAGAHQLCNAASALLAVHLLRDRLPVGVEALEAGVGEARAPARFQELVDRGPDGHEVPVVLDIAHNPDAAIRLAQCLRASHRGAGATLAVTGVLADKDHARVLAALRPVVDAWFLAPPPSDRALEPARLREALAGREGDGRETEAHAFASVEAAYGAALAAAKPGDRLLVTGSCYTVGAVLGSRPALAAGAFGPAETGRRVRA